MVQMWGFYYLSEMALQIKTDIVHMSLHIYTQD